MANKFRGEAVLDREDGSSLKLIFDANAFAILETEWDKSMKGVIEYISTWTEDTLRTADLIMLLYASTWREHRLSREEAGDVLSEVGHEAATSTIMLAVQRAMPDAKKAPTTGEVKPPRQRRGTGTKP